jgi:outer membrane protein OmpA-like peptidoglycan-associated protein
MKKIILFFVLVVFLSANLIAQPKRTFGDNWHININAGPTIFLGDVTQHYDWYKMDVSNPKASFGINITKEFSCAFSMRGQLGYGWLAGKKDFYAGGNPANLSFNAHFYHFNLQGKVNFLDLFGKGKCFRKFNFYGFVGIGFINFQNRLFKNDVEVLSWGYGRIGTHKWVTEITVPFGLGLDVRLGQKWRINLDVEAVFVDNEKLDRVVGMYEHDAFIYPNLGVSYNISKYNRVCCKKADNTPIYDASNKDQFDNLNKVLAKTDSLNNLLDKSLNKINGLNDKIDLANDKLDSLKFRRDTVYIVREGTQQFITEGIQYPDSVNKAMKDAGYIWYNVYFDLDKYNIKPEYETVIAKVASVMKAEPDLKVRIVGNADQQGSTLHNEMLSKNRSQAVINVLVNKHGINRNRLVLDYKGDREPISKIHFEVNRRVDFIKIQN